MGLEDRIKTYFTLREQREKEAAQRVREAERKRIAAPPENFRSLYEKCGEKQGSPVLVMEQHEEPMVQYCVAPPFGHSRDDMRVHTEERLGIIKSNPHWEREKHQAILPMKKHLWSHGWRWEEKDGPINIDAISLLHLGHVLRDSSRWFSCFPEKEEPRFVWSVLGGYGLQVYVGVLEIEEYARQHPFATERAESYREALARLYALNQER